MVAVKPVYLLAGGIVAAAALFVAVKGAKGAGVAAGSAAVDFVDGVFQGTIETAGELVGIPKTNQTQCELDKAAGRTYEASFSCPAGDFLKYLWS